MNRDTLKNIVAEAKKALRDMQQHCREHALLDLLQINASRFSDERINATRAADNVGKLVDDDVSRLQNLILWAEDFLGDDGDFNEDGIVLVIKRGQRAANDGVTIDCGPRTDDWRTKLAMPLCVDCGGDLVARDPKFPNFLSCAGRRRMDGQRLPDGGCGSEYVRNTNTKNVMLRRRTALEQDRS